MVPAELLAEESGPQLLLVEGGHTVQETDHCLFQRKTLGNHDPDNLLREWPGDQHAHGFIEGQVLA